MQSAGIINMREKMWVILKVKATRHPCYSADNFLHADNRGSEGEHSPSVGEKTQNKTGNVRIT